MVHTGRNVKSWLTISSRALWIFLFLTLWSIFSGDANTTRAFSRNRRLKMKMSKFKSKSAINPLPMATNPAKTLSLKVKTSSPRSSSLTILQSRILLVKVPIPRKSSCATADLLDTTSIEYRRNKFGKCGWQCWPCSEFEKMTDQLNLTDAQKTMCK